MCEHGMDALFHAGGRIPTIPSFPFPACDLDFLGSARCPLGITV